LPLRGRVAVRSPSPWHRRGQLDHTHPTMKQQHGEGSCRSDNGKFESPIKVCMHRATITTEPDLLSSLRLGRAAHFSRWDVHLGEMEYNVDALEKLGHCALNGGSTAEPSDRYKPLEFGRGEVRAKRQTRWYCCNADRTGRSYSMVPCVPSTSTTDFIFEINHDPFAYFTNSDVEECL
jgi:hypothetical protein